MKKLTNLLAVILVVMGMSFTNAQRKSKNKNKTTPILVETKPKLIVGIIVDQMRYDYLTRFWDHYGANGFKRMISEGFNCKNHHFNYAPTSTGPGHASVYTGTTPATHGIIANNWYDKETDTEIYCAADDSFETVGTTSDAGKMSPHRILSSTITDELRLNTQLRGKTIAIALKDRGAVLPGGHTANAAYWFEGDDVGKWITSSYYMPSLPSWVNSFNDSGQIQSYKKEWNTLKPIGQYIESGPDNNTFEGLFETETSPTFPHSTPNLLNKTKDFEIIKYTPFGNSLTLDFAIAALENEGLGDDANTDFLAISFSSTDYIGHKYGVNSKEIQDAYVRLDLDLARLFAVLDEKVGAGAYTVFLTADHGAVEVPAYLTSQKIPSGYIKTAEMKTQFIAFLKYRYGTTDILKSISNNQVFLDRKVIGNLDMDLDDVQEEIALELLRYDDVDKVYTGYQMWQNEYTHGIPYILQNGWHQKRSGDVLLVQKPGFVSYPGTGSSHGSAMIYDTHVPLLFFGNGIKKGETVGRTEIPDVAPTIASLLGISFPNGTTGKPIAKVLE